MEEVEDTDGTVYFGDKALSVRLSPAILIRGRTVKERVDRLSGGDCRDLVVHPSDPDIVVLDEPTNDLDLASLRMLEEALVDFEGSVLVVSHDRFFLDRICDQIVAFEDDGVFVTPGNYSYYLENKQARDERDKKLFQAVATSNSNKISAPRPATAVRKLTFKEQRELEGMEASIHAAEARVEGLEADLNDPNFYVKRAAEAPQLVLQLSESKAEVSRLYMRWAALEQRPSKDGSQPD